MEGLFFFWLCVAAIFNCVTFIYRRILVTFKRKRNIQERQESSESENKKEDIQIFVENTGKEEIECGRGRAGQRKEF